MTRNQIEYLKLQEQKRSNSAQEAETKRANLAREGETARSNLVRESQNQIALDETSRHNQAAEGLGQAQLDEAKRSNLVREQETMRSNLERERLQGDLNAETRRANRERERQGEIQLAEQRRANLANEALRSEANSETQRANRAMEEYRAQSLAAQIDFNQRTADWRDSSLIETSRSNQAREQISRDTLEETRRHNLAWAAAEAAKQVTNAGYLAEQVRADIARETETALHNRAMELKQYGTVVTLNPTNNVTAPLSLPEHQESNRGSRSKSEPVVVRTKYTGETSGASGGSRASTTVRYGVDYMSDGTVRNFKEETSNGFKGKTKKTYY